MNVVEETGADGYIYGTVEVGGETKRTWWLRVSSRAECSEKVRARPRVVPRPGETHVFSSSASASASPTDEKPRDRVIATRR